MKLLVISILLCHLHSFAQNMTLNAARSHYILSSESEKEARILYNGLALATLNNDVKLYGYKGIASCMMAKYAFLPTTKFNHFQEGKTILEACIKANPNDIELRYLRLAVQLHSPSLLGYKANIDEDKKMLLKAFQEKNNDLEDETLAQMIIDFVVSNNICTVQGLKTLNKR